jgi:hypothetical protein
LNHQEIEMLLQQKAQLQQQQQQTGPATASEHLEQLLQPSRGEGAGCTRACVEDGSSDDSVTGSSVDSDDGLEARLERHHLQSMRLKWAKGSKLSLAEEERDREEKYFDD